MQRLSQMCRHGNRAWLSFGVHRGHTGPAQTVEGISLNTVHKHTTCVHRAGFTKSVQVKPPPHRRRLSYYNSVFEISWRQEAI